MKSPVLSRHPAARRLAAVLLLGSVGSSGAADPADPADPAGEAQAKVRATFERHLHERAAASPEQQITPEFPSSREQWTEHAAGVREKLRAVFHFPEHEAPLSARVTGRIDRGDFAIEKVVYRAEADNWVTALLYLPLGLDGPLPAIVCPSGHGGSKSTPYNQYFAQMYARAGCIVLVPDTIGEEERDEHFRLGGRGHRIEHRVDRCQALGISVIGKMVYDIVRGVDYLLSRPETDPARIGCVGHSLGGTLTQYAAAVDPRISLSMPTAWTCNFQQIVGELSCCWRPVGLLQAANDPELLALGAPHCATLVLGGENDRTPMLPAEFLQTTEAPVRQVYELFGRGEAFAVHVTPGADHQPFQLNRTALAWVERHFDLPRLTKEEIEAMPEGPPSDEFLMAEMPAPFANRSWQTERLAKAKAVRSAVRLLPAEALRCLQAGEESDPEYSMDGWMKARTRERRAELSLPESPEAWKEQRSRLIRRIEETLQLPASAAPLEPELVRQWTHQTARVEEYRYGLLGLSSYLLRPPAAADAGPLPVVLHLPARRIKEDALESECVAGILAGGSAVLALDSVPFDESAFLLGTSPTAYNVRHVIDSIDAIGRIPGLDAGRVACLGEVDDVALLAALLDPRIGSLTLPDHPRTLPPRQRYRLDGIVPGLEAVAPRARLPALLAPRALEIASPAFDRAFVERAYRLAGAPDAARFPEP